MSSETTETFSSFVNENSNFLLSTFGMMGICVSGFLLFVLKSRCTEVKCCGIFCKRDVISEENLNTITMTRIPEV